MDKRELNRECAGYFKSNKGFKRLFEGIREKYRSFGYAGGVVKLDNLTPMEKEALSGLLKKDYYSRKSSSIRIDDIISALEDTRFQGVDFGQVLMLYFNENLISKKEERTIYNDEREEYFKGILNGYEDTRAGRWLSCILQSKENPYKTLMQKYDLNNEELKDNLFLLFSALNSLSFDKNAPMRLALFSSLISKNPHSFDMNSDLGKLLLYGAAYFLDAKYPSNAEEKAELLYSAGIITDEISNYTMLSGLIAIRDGIVHDGWQGFYDSGEPMQASLWNLSMVDSVISPGRRVFVFENPTVFSEVLYNTLDLKPSLLCTYGQIKLASLVLLDKLVENVDYIYYSGDFDPEGILIADRLKERYGEKLILWRYTVEDYELIKSSEQLDTSRLKKFEKLKDSGLKKLASHIMNDGRAAYQELLADKYVEDVSGFLGTDA